MARSVSVPWGLVLGQLTIKTLLLNLGCPEPWRLLGWAWVFHFEQVDGRLSMRVASTNNYDLPIRVQDSFVDG